MSRWTGACGAREDLDSWRRPGSSRTGARASLPAWLDCEGAACPPVKHLVQDLGEQLKDLGASLVHAPGLERWTVGWRRNHKPQLQNCSKQVGRFFSAAPHGSKQWGAPKSCNGLPGLGARGQSRSCTLWLLSTGMLEDSLPQPDQALLHGTGRFTHAPWPSY